MLPKLLLGNQMHKVICLTNHALILFVQAVFVVHAVFIVHAVQDAVYDIHVHY